MLQSDALKYSGVGIAFLAPKIKIDVLLRCSTLMVELFELFLYSFNKN